MISEEIIKAINREAVLFVIDCNNHIKRIPTANNITYLCDSGGIFCYPLGNCSIDNVFETEEEAEEYLKYGNITRTEKLELPMWKDVERAIKEDAYIDFRFETYNNNLYSLEVLPYDNIVRICDESICLFFQELTRENYHKALDLAIRLWKGEE